MWNKDCSKILEVKKKKSCQDSYSLMGDLIIFLSTLSFFFLFLKYW